MKKVFVYSLISLTTLTLGGCWGRPDYPASPSISFREIKFIKGKNFQQDTVALLINFRDGDGNLGLSATDTGGIYTRRRPNSSEYNPNYFNIFVDAFKKNANGTIDSIPMPSLSSIDSTFYGRFPRIRSEKSGPLDGILRYDLKSFDFFNGTATNVSFKIRIQDRALNKSERISTPFINIQ